MLAFLGFPASQLLLLAANSTGAAPVRIQSQYSEQPKCLSSKK
jgi:hypothetical protein